MSDAPSTLNAPPRANVPAVQNPPAAQNVANWTFAQRLLETLSRSKSKLLPEAWEQLQAIMTLEAMAVVAAVLVAWVVSHAFGVGAVVDVIIAAVGVAAIGLAVFSGLDHLYQFAVGAYTARTSADLDAAAEHFAEAVAILGIQAVLAFLLKGAPRTYSGAHVQLKPPPLPTPGLRYKPSVGYKSMKPNHHGSTDAWGDIVINSKLSATDRAIALLHEKVHRFLTPKLYLLRNFRVQQRIDSYVKSSLSRYLEEALCETVAQVGVVGMRKFCEGISFPVSNGYVFLLLRGGGRGLKGNGLLPEGAGLIAGGLLAHGLLFDAWFSAFAPPAPAPAARPAPPFLPVPR
jgi:hypothetical protein